MSDEPAIVLLGYGVRDTLQLTVEAQRAITRAGRVYALDVPQTLARYLKSQRVACTELADRFEPGRPYSEAYLEIADYLLRRAGEDPPVVFLTGGNPLFLNSLNRFIVMQARERDLPVHVIPGVSELDALICDLGLDVGTFGLQLFDARRMVSRAQAINPQVPLIVLQLAGFAGEAVPATRDGGASADYVPLASHLGRFYQAEHPVTLIDSSGRSDGLRTLPLAHFADLTSHITSTSHLFIDAVRQRL